MDDTPSTTRVRSTSSDSDSGSSGSSDASDGDSPSPVGVIDIFEQYRNDFHLTSDLLRHIDKRRMRKLLPPKLSQRGLALSSEKKTALEELEEDIALSLNAVR